MAKKIVADLVNNPIGNCYTKAAQTMLPAGIVEIVGLSRVCRPQSGERRQKTKQKQ